MNEVVFLEQAVTLYVCSDPLAQEKPEIWWSKIGVKVTA